jgi:1,4-dihydroxy-2-naphthoate octaprenyltransferase
MSKLAAYAGVAKAPFLTLPFALVAAGTAAAAYDDTAGVLPTVLALVGLLALHVAVNAFNEASDMKRGIDLHTVRTPFSGGSGVLPAGDLTVRDAVTVGIAGSLIGLVIGVYILRTLGWWPFSVVMALGALAVLIYTDVFVRTGFGELFAGLGLGLLPVIGTALVQRNVIGPAAWAVGVPAFFMTFNLLLLNEFPDEQADRDGGRVNLILIFGRRAAACIYTAAVAAVPVSILAAVGLGALPAWAIAAIAPTWFARGAVRWALTQPDEPVPLPAMAGNVIWNHATLLTLAAALGVSAWLR